MSFLQACFVHTNCTSKNHASTYDLIPLYEYLFDSVWICKANSRVGEIISTVGPPRSARGLLDKKKCYTITLLPYCKSGLCRFWHNKLHEGTQHKNQRTFPVHLCVWVQAEEMPRSSQCQSRAKEKSCAMYPYGSDTLKTNPNHAQNH